MVATCKPFAALHASSLSYMQTPPPSLDVSTLVVCLVGGPTIVVLKMQFVCMLVKDPAHEPM